jgi:hypothetical protein
MGRPDHDLASTVMTRAARVRQSDIERAIAGAAKAGLQVGSVEVRPDGTVIVRTPLDGLAEPRKPVENGKGGNEWDEVLQEAQR